MSYSYIYHAHDYYNILNYHGHWDVNKKYRECIQGQERFKYKEIKSDLLKNSNAALSNLAIQANLSSFDIITNITRLIWLFNWMHYYNQCGE